MRGMESIRKQFVHYSIFSITVLVIISGSMVCQPPQEGHGILQVDFPPPVYVDSPQDLTYLVDTAGHRIIWQPTYDGLDFFASYVYNVWRNGTYIQGGLWGSQDDEPIVVSIDGLSPGVYNFTIRISNYYVARDTVFVTVYGPHGWPFLVIGTLASFILAVSIYFIRKFRH